MPRAYAAQLDQVQTLLAPEHDVKDDGGNRVAAQDGAGLVPRGRGMHRIGVPEGGAQGLAGGGIVVHDQDVRMRVTHGARTPFSSPTASKGWAMHTRVTPSSRAPSSSSALAGMSPRALR